MAGETAFLELARLFEALEETTKRNEKKALISSFFQRLEKEEIQPVVSFLTGRVFPEADPRILEVGERTIWEIMKNSTQTILTKKKITILEATEYFNNISKLKGKGSRRKRQNLAESLLSQATSLEQKYFIRLILGEMRIGVVEGITLEAIADASSLELGLVRRANMLLGNLGKVAEIALQRGVEDLKNVSLNLFQPIKPMLAEMSYDLEEVFSKHKGRTGFEFKYDGARVQIHLKKDKVKIFSRSLTDVTISIPEIVKLVKDQINAKDALLEGEVVAYGDDNKPLPFQYLMRRFRRIHQIEAMIKEVPLKMYLFDVLYLNGELLIDKQYSERRKLLSAICKPDLLVERIITTNISEVKDFLEKALKNGHEGLIAKALNSNYTPGKRGKKWLKIKPVETLDLVITAADWGYGRRREWLSNYHLAARDEENGEYLNLGKTFKGLTDNEFSEITDQLQKIKIKENRYTVYVQPKVVVEVAFNEIQKSSTYKSGFALRFARIKRIRYDKHPENTDTITRIRKLYEKQFMFKAKLELINLKNMK